MMSDLYIKKDDVRKMLTIDTEAGIVITKDFCNTIAIYRVDEFEKFLERLAKLPRDKSHIVRFFAGAACCDMKWDDYPNGFPISNLLLEFGEVVEGAEMIIWTIGSEKKLYLSSNKENMQNLLEELLQSGESIDTLVCRTCVLMKEEDLF